MTVSYVNQTDASADEDMNTVNRQRLARVVGEVKSSPVGVDWQMIRTMRAGRGTRGWGDAETRGC